MFYLINMRKQNKTNNTTQKAMKSTLCVCVCKHANQPIQESIEKRRKELILNKTQLSFNIRKRTSAGDNRKTSRNIFDRILYD